MINDFFNIWIERHGIKKIHWKVNTFEGHFSMCSYNHCHNVYHLGHVVHNNYFLIQLCGRTISKFNFFTKVLSIGGGLVEES